MDQWESVDDVLAFAIQNEENAVTFYLELAEKATAPSTKQAFEEFALEEEYHKAKLLEIKSSGQMTPAAEKVMDLQIADYLVDIEPAGDLDYMQALILAIKQEQVAFKMYTDLAASAEDADLRKLLLRLAQEEAKHRLKFESEYDDFLRAREG